MITGFSRCLEGQESTLKRTRRLRTTSNRRYASGSLSMCSWVMACGGCGSAAFSLVHPLKVPLTKNVTCIALNYVIAMPAAYDVASLSHRSLSGLPECPRTHLHSTVCCSSSSSRTFHRSAFGTGLLFFRRITQPFSLQACR